MSCLNFFSSGIGLRFSNEKRANQIRLIWYLLSMMFFDFKIKKESLSCSSLFSHRLYMISYPRLLWSQFLWKGGPGIQIPRCRLLNYHDFAIWWKIGLSKGGGGGGPRPIRPPPPWIRHCPWSSQSLCPDFSDPKPSLKNINHGIVPFDEIQSIHEGPECLEVFDYLQSTDYLTYGSDFISIKRVISDIMLLRAWSIYWTVSTGPHIKMYSVGSAQFIIVFAYCSSTDLNNQLIEDNNILRAIFWAMLKSGPLKYKVWLLYRLGVA